MPRTVKIDTSKLTLLPVPEGLFMRYKHFYKPNTRIMEDVEGNEVEVIIGPKQLDMTVARLEDSEGDTVCEGDSLVNPNDVPIKKLGRVIAHNRCVKLYHRLSGAKRK
jgi:hypothetical protein